MTAIEQVKTVLAEQISARGLETIQAYCTPPTSSAQSTLAVIGLRRSESKDSGFLRYLGMNEEDGVLVERYGKEICLTLSFDIYAPRTEGAEGCIRAAETAEEALFSALPSGLRVEEVHWEKPVWDKTYGMFFLPGDTMLRAYLFAVTDEEGIPLTDFILRGVVEK